ncbi:MAG: membrane protein insertion efficiency factor YidD [Clostridiales bacterium]|nr:membrane protein insertion efficiency factor YidD [Clostridiales bacterium]
MKRSFLASAMLKSVDFYRRAISPYKGGPTCKYVPTCSQYARIAIERYGALKGGRLAAFRLMRCNPWSKGGYDPVPDDPGITMKKE